MEPLTDRQCPLCQTNNFEILIKVDPEVFVKDNATIGREQLQSSGMLELEHIPIVRCDNCHFVYTQKLLSSYWLDIFWNHIFLVEESQKKIKRNKKRLRNLKVWSELGSYLLRKHLSDPAQINILEYGCGWGDFMTTARSENVSCLGIEIDPTKVAYCKQQGIEIYKNLDQIPKNRSFNILYSDQVVEHLPDPVGTMEKIKPWLTPDFVGFFSVPNYSDKRMKQSIANIQSGKTFDKDLITWDHLNYFSPSSVYGFLNQCGFEVFDIYTNQIIAKKNLTTTSCYFRYKQTNSYDTNKKRRENTVWRLFAGIS